MILVVATQTLYGSTDRLSQHSISEYPAFDSQTALKRESDARKNIERLNGALEMMRCFLNEKSDFSVTVGTLTATVLDNRITLTKPAHNGDSNCVYQLSLHAPGRIVLAVPGRPARPYEKAIQPGYWFNALQEMLKITRYMAEQASNPSEKKNLGFLSKKFEMMLGERFSIKTGLPPSSSEIPSSIEKYMEILVVVATHPASGEIQYVLNTESGYLNLFTRDSSQSRSEDIQMLSPKSDLHLSAMRTLRGLIQSAIASKNAPSDKPKLEWVAGILTHWG
jgi:hypothetical protein